MGGARIIGQLAPEGRVRVRGLRFASLGTTEQGDSGAQFRVDYLKETGALGLYHPDFVAVQVPV